MNAFSNTFQHFPTFSNIFCSLVAPIIWPWKSTIFSSQVIWTQIFEPRRISCMYTSSVVVYRVLSLNQWSIDSVNQVKAVCWSVVVHIQSPVKRVFRPLFLSSDKDTESHLPTVLYCSNGRVWTRFCKAYDHPKIQPVHGFSKFNGHGAHLCDIGVYFWAPGSLTTFQQVSNWVHSRNVSLAMATIYSV